MIILASLLIGSVLLLKIFFTVDPNHPTSNSYFNLSKIHIITFQLNFILNLITNLRDQLSLALKFGITTRVEFIPSIYRLILGIEPVRTDDLQLVQPDVYKNLMLLKEYFADEETIEGPLILIVWTKLMLTSIVTPLSFFMIVRKFI